MRDLVFTLMSFGFFVSAISRPWLGVLIWTCLDYMNPHRFCYSYAKYLMPYSLIIAAVTIISILTSHERLRFAWSREVFFLCLFIAWMTFTSFFALNDEAVWKEWDRSVKVQMLIFVTLICIRKQKHMHLLVWTIAVSIGVYGVKGGLWALRTGGMYRVQGPEYTFIEDTNDLALALVTVLPLMRYLQVRSSKRWVKLGLGVAMGLTSLAILSTYSRAGMLALVAVTIFMILKSRKKMLFGGFAIVLVILLTQFMPQAWYDRMNTIQTYKTDNSAQGRLNAWYFAWNLAKDKPILGGGFRCFTPKFFLIWAPNPGDFHAAHSVFLKILAEHGFPGLILFLLMFGSTWFTANWVRRNGPAYQMTWASDLAAMIQVALLGYAVGGAFSNLSYFGLPYQLMAVVVLCKAIVQDASVDPTLFENRDAEPEAALEAQQALSVTA